MGTDQRIDLVDLCNQSGPCRAAGTLRHRPRRGSLGVGGQLLGMRVFPGWRGDTRYVGPALPAPQVGILLEVGIVGGVIEDFAPGAVMGNFLQGQRSAGNVLSQSLAPRCGMPLISSRA